MFGTGKTVFTVVQEVPLVGLLWPVPGHGADDVIVEDVQAGGEDGGPDEEVDGARPEVGLTRPQASEADGSQRHEAEVERVVETPVLEFKVQYFSQGSM